MTSFFTGNPFATPVGQMIEQATDGSLASENWGLNMEICDLINDSPDGPKDAIKAIKKRIQQNAGKNYTVIMYTLVVLETCVKNCGLAFHVQATSKDFVQELVRLIGPKNDPPTAVQEKVLSLIQTWSEAFRSNPDMNGVTQVYQDLKSKGVEFPMTDLDCLAPIFTPQRSVSESERALQANRTASETTERPARRIEPVPHAGPVHVNSEQVTKLRSDMGLVLENMQILSEMLTELTPGKEHPSDLELLQELHKTCRSMQVRVVELIDGVANEEITVELLRVNDELNNLFLRYSRFEKNRGGSQRNGEPAATQQPPFTLPPPKKAAAKPAEKPLIDLDDSVELKAAACGDGLAKLELGAKGGQHDDEDFDMFAQSRNATYEKTKTSGSSYTDNINLDQTCASIGAISNARVTQKTSSDDYLDPKLQTEHDFDEMEAWLSDKAIAGGDKKPDNISSAEFDKFLAERAAVVDTLPNVGSIPAATGRSTVTKESKDKGDSAMFGL